MWKRAGLILVLGLGAGSPTAADTAGNVTVTPDVVYGHKAGMALTFDMFRPAAATGAAVIFVNSGGFVSGQLRQCESTGWGAWRFVPAAELRIEGVPEALPMLAQFSFGPLLDAGFTVFDVRHDCGSGAKLPDIVGDVHRAVRFIRNNAGRLGVDADRIGLWGASAGGYLALEAALAGDDGAAPVRAVAAYYPAGFDLAGDTARFPELLANLPALQVGTAVLDSLSLRHYVSPDDPPCLIVFGTADAPFITGPSDSLSAALTRAGVACRRIAFPGTGHEFRGPDGYQSENGERALREVVAWFGERLARR